MTLAPRDAVKLFTDVIAVLLAVGFEAADLAADPDTSRALVALVSFAQGKEYAGQERASAGAGLSLGKLTDTDRRHLQRLVAAQERAFSVFAEFADPIDVTHLRTLNDDQITTQLHRLRAAFLENSSNSSRPEVSADTWYEVATQRIDAMRRIEKELATDLERLCLLKLTEARASAKSSDILMASELTSTASFAMLVAEVEPNDNGTESVEAVGLYGTDSDLPKPMRSILNVMEAQSRRIDDMSSQLESARVAMSERKTIERARGILMRSRRLSEADAYGLMRRTAMGQNKRIIEIAEAIVSMADMFKG